MKLFSLIIFAVMGLCSLAVAEEPQSIYTVEVTENRPEIEAIQSVQKNRLSTGDPAAVLEGQPGLYRSSGGGISSLPVLHGFNDDRIKIIVDGAAVSSACGNHMNPPLSYVDPFAVNSIEVQSRAPSVSIGGDNLAGTIVIKSAPPVFAEAPGKLHRASKISSIYRSNNDAISESVSTVVANDFLSIGYDGSFNRGNSYIDGHGNKVRSTQYEAWNHAFTVAAQGDDNLLTLKAGLQEVPYQGYVNQYMDLVDNRAKSLTLSDTAEFDWGSIDARVFWQDTKHDMGFFSREKVGTMPMNVRGKDMGYAIGANVKIDEENVLHFGDELHRFELDDRWPPVMGSMMMEPNTYVNINNGHRQLFDNYVECEFLPTSEWRSLVGVRHSLVGSDAGQVQPYQSLEMMPMNARAMDMPGGHNIDAANTFNALEHVRHDSNFNATARVTYEPSKMSSLELGYTLKTRSPNLYERYSWGRGTMAMTMIGWFGDANGYVGNLDLEPETAHTVSANLKLHDEGEERWSLQVTPYFSYIEDYIDVDKIGTFNPLMKMDDTKSLLQFANHDARIGGVDVTAGVRVWDDEQFGQGRVKGMLSWIRGERTDSNDSLYHMMPFNGRVALEQSKGGWSTTAEFELVDEKLRVDPLRDELPTSGYVITNLFASYRWSKVRLDVGVANLFDKFHYLPLGGVDYADWKADGGVGQMRSVPGIGRSFNAGITVEF